MITEEQVLNGRQQAHGSVLGHKPVSIKTIRVNMNYWLFAFRNKAVHINAVSNIVTATSPELKEKASVLINFLDQHNYLPEHYPMGKTQTIP